MSDNTPNLEDPTKQADPNPTPPAPAPPKQDDDIPDADDDMSLEDYKQALAKARGQSADYRKQASERQKQLDAIKQKEMQAETERLKEQGKFKEAAEKAQKDLEEFKKTSEQRQIATEVKAAAINAGILTDKAAKLIDLTNVKFDDSGELIGVKEAIAALKADAPELFKQDPDKSKEVKNTGSDKGDPPPGSKPGTPNALATKSDGSYVLSDKEYEKAKKERLKTL